MVIFGIEGRENLLGPYHLGSYAQPEDHQRGVF